MSDEGQSVKNMARTRFGILALVLSLIALALAFMFFTADKLVIMQIDFSGDEDAFGWISMVISLGSAAIGLFLFMTMSSD
jgi:hypothetical protein